MWGLDAFEMWTYGRMLAISWIHCVINFGVLNRAGKPRQRMQGTKTHKAAYLSYVLRHDRYEFLQLIMIGQGEGQKGHWPVKNVVVAQYPGTERVPFPHYKRLEEICGADCRPSLVGEAPKEEKETVQL